MIYLLHTHPSSSSLLSSCFSLASPHNLMPLVLTAIPVVNSLPHSIWWTFHVSALEIIYKFQVKVVILVFIIPHKLGQAITMGPKLFNWTYSSTSFCVVIKCTINQQAFSYINHFYMVLEAQKSNTGANAVSFERLLFNR